MLVRIANFEDHDNVIGLMQFLHPSDPKISRDVSQAIFTEILESRRFIITVAEFESKLVGSCYINIVPNITRGGAPYAVIENVVTHPNFRRQGIGSSLIADALARAENDGCYKAMLLTGGDVSVHQFYESCGMKSGVKTAFIERW